MRKDILFFLTICLLCLIPIQPAHAAFDVEGIYTISAIFNIVLLLCAIICLIWSLKILSLVRGGLISKSWQMFVLGFCFLILAQLLAVGEKAGLFVLPVYIGTVLYLMMAMTWLAGLYQTRKVLG
jgi:hypothetical protein